MNNCYEWAKKKPRIIDRTEQQMLQDMQGKDPEKSRELENKEMRYKHKFNYGPFRM